ncbi:hypothetical protein BN439_1088 [Erwinia amylovora Ea644]|nr:hypothetical protein BN439_1088 [Erwinia amylovora Ea644]CCP06201.1 hypothetical protein BN440_1152 [Erwinia amylovora MR1]
MEKTDGKMDEWANWKRKAGRGGEDNARNDSASLQRARRWMR